MTNIPPHRVDRFAGFCCTAGAVVMAVVSLMTVLDDSLARAGTTAFHLSGVFLVFGHLLVVAGILGLARSAVAGSGPLARVGLPVAAAGALLITTAELFIRFDDAVGEMFFGIGTPLAGLGMILAGVGVLRTGLWYGWRRFTPLLCGLYVFVVLYPAEAFEGGASYPAIAGWNVCWALLGTAFVIESGTVGPVVSAMPAANEPG